MKSLTLSLMMLLLSTFAIAQFEQKQVKGDVKTVHSIEPIQLNTTVGAPIEQNPNRVSDFDLQGKSMTVAAFVAAQARPNILMSSEWGVPTWIAGKAESIAGRHFDSPESAAIAYVMENHDILPIENEQEDLHVVAIEEQPAHKMTHVKIQQRVNGFDVFGGEVWVHLKNGIPTSMTGRLFPATDLELPNFMNEQTAYEKIKSGFGLEWSLNALEIEGYEVAQYNAQLVWLPLEESKTMKLAYVADVYPDFIHKYFIAIDAATGEELSKYMSMCYLHNHDNTSQSTSTSHTNEGKSVESTEATTTASSAMLGDETANGVDLFGINRTFNVINEGGTYYMVDISRDMHDAAASSLPSHPVGALRTLDGLSNPINSSFSYAHVTSTNNNWNDPATVSAHYNMGKAYEYFLNTFTRNSINGSGSTVTSFVHVNDENNQSMGNAFWNGEAMFYGDGDAAFWPLARALDVAGHEISHGVVQNTANLVYENEPGALNESFADIFGAMIDRDDWLIGEEVVKTSQFPSGALRNMQDPTQGFSQLSDPGYQPDHYSQRYTGSQDRGGVHINSGITNRAFYLFATSIGKVKAEQIYYYALSNYLTRSSQFKDCRAAVMQAALDLYGATESSAAATAFDQVGIFGSGGGGGPVVPGDNLELPINPGADLIVYADDNTDQLVLIDGNGTQLVNPFTAETPLSKPSVSDNGSRIVFVNDRNNLHLIDINWGASTFNDTELTTDQAWRNVCISKDGTLIAATTSDPQNAISVFKLATGTGLTFPLSNPTTGGGAAGEVLYSDAMEFDYSGRYVLYDAVNEISGTTENIQYWDIGVLRAWDKSAGDFGDGQITKLFSGLPEGISIGNPTLSKTRPNILAYDVVEEGFFNDTYYLYASNIETNNTAQVYANEVVSYPSFSRTDDLLLFNAQNTLNQNVVGQISLLSDKITPTGDPTVFLDQAYWATWFANGTRNINVANSNTELNALIDILPNPASEFLTIKLEEEAGVINEIRIIDINGKTIFNQTAKLSQHIHRISLRDMPNGNYLLSVQTSKGKSIQPFIIQH